MKKITKNDLLDILKEQLKDLNNEIFKAQLDVFKQEPHNNIEWFNIALTNMVHSNINAFLSLLETNNFFAACALIRMQLNCLSRIFSVLTIIPQDKWININLYDSEPWKYKIIKDGKTQPLHDTFFYEQLQKNKVYSVAKDKYKYYCQFIHPSKIRFGEAVREWQQIDNMQIKWATRISINGTLDKSEEEIINYIKDMLEITTIIKNLICVTKQTNNYTKYRLANV